MLTSPTGQGCAGVVRDCDGLQARGDLVRWRLGGPRHLLEQHRLPRLALQRQVSLCPSLTRPLLLLSSRYPYQHSLGVKLAVVNIIFLFVISLTMFSIKCQLSPTLLPNLYAGSNIFQFKSVVEDTCV